MMYQIIDSYTLRSSCELNTLPNGAPCSNVTVWLESHPEAQAQYGWYFLDSSAPQPETGTYRQRYELIDNVIVMSWEEYVPEPAPVVVRQLAKIKIRKWLQARGLGEIFKAILASDPDAQDDWSDAVVLDEDDPKVVNICAAFVAQGLLTDADIALMKDECLSPYQTPQE